MCSMFPCQAEEIFDFTNAEIRTPEMEWWFLTIRSSEFWPLKPSLSILSLKFDRENYTIGQEFIYEVVVKNVSGGDLIIPIESDGFKVINNVKDKPPSGFLVVAISLVTYDENKDKFDREYEYFTTIGLYGSDLLPSSLKTLKPDESVTIRARGTWEARQINSRNPEDIKYGPLKVYARWSFRYWLIPGLENMVELKPGVEIQLSAPLEEKKEDKANREPNVISFTDATFSEPIEIEFNIPSEENK